MPPLEINYGTANPLSVNVTVSTYTQRSSPEQSLTEPTGLGPPLWDGKVPGLHRVRDFILKAPEDTIGVAQRLRTAESGELDIRLSFDFDHDPPDRLVEALRARAYEILALLNLGLGDFIRPTMPFQIREMLPNDQASVKFAFGIAVHARHTLGGEKLSGSLLGIAHFLTDPNYGEKYRVALELYGAHFTEEQARVRFILLVIAMEALAESSPKNQVARDLLARWQEEIATEKEKYELSSDEFDSLNALSRELDFRSGDSVNNTIRKLFADLPGISNEERTELKRRAVRLYNKRSTLVHDGHLPIEELPSLEVEARALLEMLFVSAIDGSRPEDDRFAVIVSEPLE